MSEKIETPDSQKNNDKEEDVHIPEELLNSIPEKDRKELISSITQISTGVFPQRNPILQKITSERITSIIAYSNEEDKRDREERNGERNYNYKIFVTTVISVILISALFLYTKELDFLKYIIGAILGFAGGFGVGRSFKSKE